MLLQQFSSFDRSGAEGHYQFRNWFSLHQLKPNWLKIDFMSNHLLIYRFKLISHQISFWFLIKSSKDISSWATAQRSRTWVPSLVNYCSMHWTCCPYVGPNIQDWDPRGSDFCAEQKTPLRGGTLCILVGWRLQAYKVLQAFRSTGLASTRFTSRHVTSRLERSFRFFWKFRQPIMIDIN